MADDSWACRACEQSNESGATACSACNCPATPTATEVEAHQAHFAAARGKKYECLKCSHDVYEVGETRSSGGLLSSFFEVETEKFSFVACARCGYTEFYRRNRNGLRNVLDFSIG